MRKYIYSLLIVVGLCATACDKNTERTSEASSKPAMTSSQLEQDIKTAWNADPMLRAADLKVNADVDKNKAEISGTVDSEALRTKAVELAKSIHPGMSITDQIDVVPKEPTRANYTEDQAKQERAKARGSSETVGDSVDDAWIHMKVVGKLISDSKTPERKINVDVVQGVVTLRGIVQTMDEKTEAERVARNTDGVKSVKNELTVSKSKA